MADEAVTTDVSGIARTATGEIASTPATPVAETSSQSTTQETGSTLLTEPEKTTAEAKAEPAAKDPAKPGETAKVPEAYTDYKVPEGFEIAGELKTEIDGLFKNMGLSQENAQSLVDFYVKQTQEAFQAPFNAYKEMTDGWRDEAINHADLKGRLGPGHEVNVRIGKFLSSLPDQKLASDFRSLMDLTGVGNHPAFIRVLNYAAERLGEGSHVAGNGPSEGGQSAPGAKTQPSAAQAMFPHLPSSGR